MTDNSRIRPYIDTRIVILLERLRELHGLSIGKILTIILNDSPLFKDLLANYYSEDKDLKNIFLGLLSDKKNSNNIFKKGEITMSENLTELKTVDRSCLEKHTQGIELKGVYGIIKGTSQFREIVQIFQDDDTNSILCFDKENGEPINVEFLGSKEDIYFYLLERELEYSNQLQEKLENK